VERLELLLGSGVARVAIGVVTERQLPVGGLDGLGVGVLRYREDFVVVSSHANPSITRAPLPLRCHGRPGAARSRLSAENAYLRCSDCRRLAASPGSNSPRSSRSRISARSSVVSGSAS